MLRHRWCWAWRLVLSFQSPKRHEVLQPSILLEDIASRKGGMPASLKAQGSYQTCGPHRRTDRRTDRTQQRSNTSAQQHQIRRQTAHPVAPSTVTTVTSLHSSDTRCPPRSYTTHWMQVKRVAARACREKKTSAGRHERRSKECSRDSKLRRKAGRVQMFPTATRQSQSAPNTR